MDELKSLRKVSLGLYVKKLQKIKDNNLDLMYAVIEKYTKEEDVIEIFKKFFKDKELEYIEDCFILHNKNLKDKYKKYKYIFIDLKKLKKKSFIYFYR